MVWWSWPPAIVLWLLVLWAISVYLANKPPVLPAPLPIDARIVELPPAQPAARKAISSPTPHRIKSARPPVSKPETALTPATKPAPAPPITHQATTHAVPPTAAANPAPAPPKAANPPPPASAPPVSGNPKSDSENGTQSLGAHAIYQPNPVLPEDLRDETMHVVIVARFHIAEDGSVTVELLKSAPNPRVNQIILNTLKTWRFFPATQADKPVASTEDINISIDVGD